MPQINYLQVMGIISMLSVKHPATTKLGVDTYNLCNAHAVESGRIQAEYATASAAAQTAMDKPGILLELMAAHPNAWALIRQILVMWQTRIPDLINAGDEVQAAAVQATKGT